MNKQELEKWIEENEFTIDDDGECISVVSFRELLKTHAILPREPVPKMLMACPHDATYWHSTYKAMIKESEE